MMICMDKKPLQSNKAKRYVIVGLGGRCRMFNDAIIETYNHDAIIVGFCDTNKKRMIYHCQRIQEKYNYTAPKMYHAQDFESMLLETGANYVIVTTIDRTHHQYIVKAMEVGCNVITEKPMTTDIEKCKSILNSVRRTNVDLKVTFNYRYAPSRTKVKELMLQNAIGDVTSIHFEWLLNTQHGADYFRRWHRDKHNSGGLMVHKSTHHFDLINWWLNSAPETVFGFGKLAFYGRANAENRNEFSPYYRATGSEAAANDAFALNLRDGGELQKLYLDAEVEDGYIRDQNVFGDGISIEDTMNVLVRYKNGAQLSYSLTAYAPWEGFRVAFNGSKGRIELEEIEQSYVNAGGDASSEGATASSTLRLCKNWQKPEIIEVEKGVGGHGGGDNLMLEDIFGSGQKSDPFCRAAGFVDGARSILTGIAANQSFATGLPVRIDDLMKL
jgi:predicted dehydrogenase